jgi:hypothetical protein
MTTTDVNKEVTKSGLVLTSRDVELLTHIRRFRLLTRDQAMAVAPFQSLTRANTRLAALVRVRLLSRKQLPVYPGRGGAQALYSLGPASGAALAIDPALLTRTVRQIARWELRHVEHVRAANHVLIALIAAFRKSADAELLAFKTEPELRELFHDRELVPDGWVAWVEQGKRFNAFVEVDLHHEGLTAWRQKILRYQTYVESGVHQERFQFKAFRVLVLAKTAARLEHLRHVAQVAGRLCLFAELDTVTAATILTAVWRPASGSASIALREA